MSTVSPIHILGALSNLEREWPSLIGTDWPRLERRYRELRSKVETDTGPTQMLAAAEIMELFAPYHAARERLNEAIAAETEAGRVLFAVARIAEKLSLDSAITAQLKEAARPNTQHRYVLQKNPTKAISFKLENVLLRFEPGLLSELVLGLIVTATKDVLGEANLVLRAAGVLLMIASLYKATTLKLDEREATVFCGFARAPRKADGSVKEEVILAHTNAVRHSVSLKPLDREELGNALYNLAEIRTVERVSGKTDTWRIIEQHNVKRSM